MVLGKRKPGGDGVVGVSLETPVEKLSVVAFKALPRQRAILGLRVVDRYNNPVEGAVVSTEFYDEGDDQVSPSFWIEHGSASWATDDLPRPLYLTSARVSSMTGQPDELSSITTDNNGYAEVELRYAGVDISMDQYVSLELGGQTQVTEKITIVGQRRFCEPSNPSAVDSPYPTGGTESSPWATLVYAESQIGAENQSSKIALCIKGSVPWSDGVVLRDVGAGLVAVSSGTALQGYIRPSSLFSQEFYGRGWAVQTVSTSFAASANVYSFVHLSGISFVGANDSGLSLLTSNGPGGRLLGCSFQTSTTGALSQGAPPQGGAGSLEMLHCNVDGPVVGSSVWLCRIDGSDSPSHVSWHHCTVEDAGRVFVDTNTARPVTEYGAADYNTYRRVDLSGTGIIFSAGGGGSLTFSAWQSSGNDLSSTYSMT